MANVIINEFELVPSPMSATEASGEAAQGDSAQASSDENSPAVSPIFMTERVIRRRMERLLRVWAH